MSELCDTLDYLDRERPDGIWGSVIHLAPTSDAPPGVLTLPTFRERDGTILRGLKVHLSENIPAWAAVFCDPEGEVLGVIDMRSSPPVAESPVATIRAGAEAHSDALKSGEPADSKAESPDEVEEQVRSEA